VEDEEYERIAAAEDDHWWYRNTRGLVGDLLAPWLARARDRDLRVLDAGCGPGGNGAWLADHGFVAGLDISPNALRFVQERRPQVPVQASIQELPFASASFDVVVEITVLCSVPDDAATVRDLARVLKPGGVLVLMEPAFEVLRRAHDATVHSQRRYRRGTIEQLATRAGLRVHRSTYAYSFLAPPAAILGGVDRARRRMDARTVSDVEKRSLDGLFSPIAAAERRLLRRHDLPVGTSAIVVAVAPD
jgi:SAM-dependent methyltransferase